MDDSKTLPEIQNITLRNYPFKYVSQCSVLQVMEKPVQAVLNTQLIN